VAAPTLRAPATRDPPAARLARFSRDSQRCLRGRGPVESTARDATRLSGSQAATPPGDLARSVRQGIGTWAGHHAYPESEIVRQGTPRSPRRPPPAHGSPLAGRSSPLALVASRAVGHLLTVRIRGAPWRSRLATLATDHSGRAGALRTARARSGLKCIWLRRQRVSPSVAPLPGFRVPALGAACAARATSRRGLRGDSRAGHEPAFRAGHERAYSAGRSLRAACRLPRRLGSRVRPHSPFGRTARAAGTFWARQRSRSRPRGRSRRRERERAGGGRGSR